MYNPRTLALKIILVALVLASATGTVLAEPTTLNISQSRIQPGGLFTLTLEATPRSNLTITLTGSRGQSLNYGFIVPDSGLINENISVLSTTEPDIYQIRVYHGNETMATGSIIIAPMLHRELLQNMLQSLEGLKTRLEVYLAEREAAGEEIQPEITESYVLALRYMNQAKQQWNSSESKTAIEQLNMAQKEFQEAYMLALTIEKPVDEDAKSKLQASLLKMEAEMNRVNTTLRVINQIGIDMSSQINSLTQIQREVLDAQKSLELGDTPRAEELVKVAFQELNGLRENRTASVKAVKIRLAERYLNQVQNRIENLIQVVTEYQLRLNQTEKMRIVSTLQNKKIQLTEIKSELQLGVYDVGALQGVSDDIRATIDMISDGPTRSSLYQIDELKSQILALSTQADNQGGEAGQQLLEQIQLKLRQLENLNNQLETQTGSSTQNSGGSTKPNSGSTSPSDQKPSNTG